MRREGRFVTPLFCAPWIELRLSAGKGFPRKRTNNAIASRNSFSTICILKTMQRGLLHHLVIVVSDVRHSSRFYGPMFRYLGYELSSRSAAYEDWKRWDLDTPHEISIVQADARFMHLKHQKGAVGHHHHLAFCAADRDDIDRFYSSVLVPLEKEGLCVVENPPCECPEYGEGYYATFFSDPDGLKYEFVINPNFLKAKKERTKAGQ